jgi:UTP-glucose-1-phosphate uridylyltransferase/transcriptional regulator with XRE-family HTH domain
MSIPVATFGRLLHEARRAAGLSLSALGQKVELDASYIHRLETGKRRPSRASVLALAEALHLQGKRLNELMAQAGFAPLPLLDVMKGAVRARGGAHHPMPIDESSPGQSLDRWAQWLNAIGLNEMIVANLLRRMESKSPVVRQRVTSSLFKAFSQAFMELDSPIQMAVIPAAKEHQLIAPHVIQQLLLQSIGEAVQLGISKICLVLSAGMVESLYRPIKEALSVAVAPSIDLSYCVQARADGLGDAILQAEPLVGDAPFAVLLPDDMIRESPRQAAQLGGLGQMLKAFEQQPDANLVAVTQVPRLKMSQYGVAVIGAEASSEHLYHITDLIEKPHPADAISRAQGARGIVGRYLLQPAIFPRLRELKEGQAYPLQLTAALDLLRQEGANVLAFEFKGMRQDIGEALGEAKRLMSV